MNEKAARARELRRDTTPQARAVRSRVRGSAPGAVFPRQVPVGARAVDFACLSRRLVVESDGSQHANSTRDVVHDARPAGDGFRVLRFWNSDVNANNNGVMEATRPALTQSE